MPVEKIILFVLLGIFSLVFFVVWMLDWVKRQQRKLPTILQLAIGFVTDFLDTWGIGSYATTTTAYRVGRVVDDPLIPGTLTVGHALPTVTQAFIYIAIVKVETITLVSLIASSVLGAWLGAYVVTLLPRRPIQIGMGTALLAAAMLLLGKLLLGDPKNEEGTVALEGELLVVGIVGNFVLGALMTIGVGAYAPIMIMVSLLGMNPETAFPIMMGSCAFLMPVAGVRFIQTLRYDSRAALGLTLTGIPAVFLAAFLAVVTFKELGTNIVRWIVLFVVLSTAATILWSVFRESKRPAPSSESNPVHNDN